MITGFNGEPQPGVYSFQQEDGSERLLAKNDATSKLAGSFGGGMGAMANMAGDTIKSDPRDDFVMPDEMGAAGGQGGWSVPQLEESPESLMLRNEPLMPVQTPKPAPRARRRHPLAPAAPGSQPLPENQLTPEGYSQAGLDWQTAQGPRSVPNPDAPPSGMGLAGEVRKKGLDLPGNMTDPEAQTDRSIERKLHAQKTHEAGLEQLQLQEAAAREANERLEQQRAEVEARKRAYATEMASRDAERQEMFDAVDNHQIDPDRLFRGRPVARFMSALAAGVGAYAATVGGTRNFALDILNKNIDRDIAAQRAELGKKQGQLKRADNAYAQLIATGRTPEAAELELRAIGTRRAKNDLQIAMNSSEALKREASFGEALIQLEEADEKYKIGLLKLDQDQVTQQFAQPQPIRGAGTSNSKPLWDEKAEYERLSAMSPEELGKLGNSKAMAAQVQKYGESKKKYSHATATLRELKQLIAEEKKLQGTDTPDLPGLGGDHAFVQGIPLVGEGISKLAAQERGRRFQQLQKQMLEMTTTLVTGAAASSEQVVNFRRILGEGSFFESEFTAGLANFELLLRDQEDLSQRSFSPTARVLYRMNTGATKGLLGQNKAASLLEPAR